MDEPGTQHVKFKKPIMGDKHDAFTFVKYLKVKFIKSKSGMVIRKQGCREQIVPGNEH
jgi:hypothetical protein